jgi:hypothetical protein
MAVSGTVALNLVLALPCEAQQIVFSMYLLALPKVTGLEMRDRYFRAGASRINKNVNMQGRSPEGLLVKSYGCTIH